MTTTITAIESRQRTARATSRGHVLVIAERAGGYEWTVYHDGLSHDSGQSATLPLTVMTREQWARIDLLQHVDGTTGDYSVTSVSLRLA